MHYVVLVAGPDPEKQLAPFDELADVPAEDMPKHPFATFIDCTEEINAEMLKEHNFIQRPDGTLNFAWKTDDPALKAHLAMVKELMHEMTSGDSYAATKVLAEAAGVDDVYDFAASFIKEKCPLPEGYLSVRRPLTALPEYATFEDIAEKWFAYTKHEGVYGHWANPNGKWDWYQIGGRWTGFFKLKPRMALPDPDYKALFGFSNGEFQNLVSMYQLDPEKFDTVVKKYKGKAAEIKKAVVDYLAPQYPEHLVGSPGLMTEGAKNGYADQCRKRDIDIDGLLANALKRANDLYDQFEAATVGFDFSERDEKAQRRLRDVLFDHKLHVFSRDYWDEFCIGTGGREAYLERVSKISVISTYAYLHNGEWHESSTWNGKEFVEHPDWNGAMKAWFESLPDDTLLTVVDIHS